MAHIVVLGAGLGGTLMAYELAPVLGKDDRLSVIGQGSSFHFVPSNPWVAVGWRERDEIEVDLDAVMKKKNIAFITCGAARLHPEENRVALNNGDSVSYDYLVVATGPDLAFDEIPGLGPNHHTQSICHIDHAEKAFEAFETFVKNPGPIVVGAAQGASCFGPAYEFALILDTELRKRKLRDKVPMTFVTPEPYIGHLGLDGVGDTKGLLESEMRNRHIKWITNARITNVEAGKMRVEEIGEEGVIKKNQRTALFLFDDSAGISRRAGAPRDRGPYQSARLCFCRKGPAQPEVSQHLQCWCLRRHRTGRADAGSRGRAQDGLHDRIHGHGDRPEYRRPAEGRTAICGSNLECGLSGGFW